MSSPRLDIRGVGFVVFAALLAGGVIWSLLAARPPKSEPGSVVVGWPYTAVRLPPGSVVASLKEIQRVWVVKFENTRGWDFVEPHVSSNLAAIGLKPDEGTNAPLRGFHADPFADPPGERFESADGRMVAILMRWSHAPDRAGETHFLLMLGPDTSSAEQAASH